MIKFYFPVLQRLPRLVRRSEPIILFDSTFLFYYSLCLHFSPSSSGKWFAHGPPGLVFLCLCTAPPHPHPAPPSFFLPQSTLSSRRSQRPSALLIICDSPRRRFGQTTRTHCPPYTLIVFPHPGVRSPAQDLDRSERRQPALEAGRPREGKFSRVV